MANKSGDKNYFTFAKGFNSDANPLDFPEDFSVDEQNFEIVRDATRRRRRGIAKEAGGTSYAPPSIDLSYACRTFKWREVAGTSSINFIVIQYGSLLHFYNDSDPISDGKLVFTLDLTQFVTSSANTSLVAGEQIDSAYGRGHFFVVHKYLKPFYIKYEPAINTFSTTVINIMERDFEGVDDGIRTTAKPTGNTDAHRYNLYNRGWLATDITAFQISASKYPSKNMVPWIGYRRKTTSGVAEQDWTKEFSPDKLLSELFQDASAPIGHFIRNPFDTTQISLPDSTKTLVIAAWTMAGTGSTRTITLTTVSPHGLSVASSFAIAGQLSKYEASYGGYGGIGYETFETTFTFDGTYAVATVPATNQITFDVPFPANFIGWNDQYYAYGTIQLSVADNPYGYSTPLRPLTTEFFAGRIWYAGTPHPKLANRIFFSQIVESDAQYGKCYQVADPTDQNISDLVDTDGGVIVIPEATEIHHLLSFSGSMFVFASNGVWSISGGVSGGYFVPTSYSVRKVSDIGSVGTSAIVLAENVPLYWATSGIYAITQDSNSGYVTSQSVSEGKIDTFLSTIPLVAKKTVQCCYDDIEKRVVWIYSGDGIYSYDSALIFNVKFEAFSKWKMSHNHLYAYTISIFTIKDADVTNRIKFVGITDNLTNLSIGDPTDEAFEDWGLTEEDAFLVTGYDAAQAPQMKKTAPYVTVYQNKTETGYTAGVGTDLLPIRESSLFLQSQWDWTNRAVSGKWSSSQQVYRHRRLYMPDFDITNLYENGETLVVTRNKLRGRGRTLSLKFTAGQGKDSWLLGWTVRWNINGDY